jgi:hypothetical protein
MPVKVFVQGVGAGGAFYRLNGKLKSDKYQFTRDPVRRDRYNYTFPTVEAFNKDGPDLIEATGNPTLHIHVEPDPGEADKALTEAHAKEIKLLGESIAEKDKRIDELAKEVNDLRGQVVDLEGRGGGLTPDQIYFLKTYDQMTDVLAPLRKEGEETPLHVLCRLASVPVPEEPAETIAQSPDPSKEPPKKAEPPTPNSANQPAKKGKAARNAEKKAAKAKK